MFRPNDIVLELHAASGFRGDDWRLLVRLGEVVFLSELDYAVMTDACFFRSARLQFPYVATGIFCFTLQQHNTTFAIGHFDLSNIAGSMNRIVDRVILLTPVKRLVDSNNVLKLRLSFSLSTLPSLEDTACLESVWGINEIWNAHPPMDHNSNSPLFGAAQSRVGGASIWTSLAKDCNSKKSLNYNDLIDFVETSSGTTPERLNACTGHSNKCISVEVESIRYHDVDHLNSTSVNYELNEISHNKALKKTRGEPIARKIRDKNLDCTENVKPFVASVQSNIPGKNLPFEKQIQWQDAQHVAETTPTSTRFKKANKEEAILQISNRKVIEKLDGQRKGFKVIQLCENARNQIRNASSSHTTADNHSAAEESVITEFRRKSSLTPQTLASSKQKIFAKSPVSPSVYAMRTNCIRANNFKYSSKPNFYVSQRSDATISGEEKNALQALKNKLRSSSIIESFRSFFNREKK